MMPPLQAIGRAAGTLAAVPAALVGFAVAYFPRTLPTIIGAKLAADTLAGAWRRRHG